MAGREGIPISVPEISFPSPQDAEEQENLSERKAKVIRSLSFLVLALALIATGAVVSVLMQSDLSKVSTSEIFWGYKSASFSVLIQYRNEISEASPAPVVILLHDSGQHKESMLPYSMELAKRGFLVFSVDILGFGNSDRSGTLEEGADVSLFASMMYLLESVPKASQSVGVLGVGTGADIIHRSLERWNTVSSSDPNYLYYKTFLGNIKGVVLIGGGFSVASPSFAYKSDVSWLTCEFPPNLLVVLGQYDPIYNGDSLKLELKSSFWNPSQIITGVTYGFWTNSTARSLVVPPTGHFFQAWDASVIAATLDWLKLALVPNSNFWSAPDTTSYVVRILFGAIASVGVILSLFPLMRLFSMLFRLRDTWNSDHKVPFDHFAGVGSVYSVVSTGLLFVAAVVGEVIPKSGWPQDTLVITLFLFVFAIGGFLFLLLGRHCWNRLSVDLDWGDLGVIVGGFGGFQCDLGLVSGLLRSLGIGVICFAWMYVLVWPFDWLLALNLDALFPFHGINMNDLTGYRALVGLIYLPISFVYLVVEGMWLAGYLRLRPLQKKRSMKGFLSWALPSTLLKILPLLIVMLVQLIGSLVSGTSLIPGWWGYIVEYYVYSFITYFFISTLLLCWSVNETGQVFLGAAIGSLLYSWSVASVSYSH